MAKYKLEFKLTEIKVLRALAAKTLVNEKEAMKELHRKKLIEVGWDAVDKLWLVIHLPSVRKQCRIARRSKRH